MTLIREITILLLSIGGFIVMTVGMVLLCYIAWRTLGD